MDKQLVINAPVRNMWLNIEENILKPTCTKIEGKKTLIIKPEWQEKYYYP